MAFSLKMAKIDEKDDVIFNYVSQFLCIDRYIEIKNFKNLKI